MKVLSLIVVFGLSAIPAFAWDNPGFVCAENLGPFDGGISSIRLAPKGDGKYEMSYTTSKMDGSNATTTVLGSDLDCKFSTKDAFVAYCEGEMTEPGKPFNFFQSTKNIVTSVNPYFDGTTTSYEFKIAAPRVSDDQLNAIDPLHYNPKNKSLMLDIPLRDHGLAGCKSLGATQ